jgi:predicted phosphodiesterase
MRMALISDVHGNAVALDAVLRDARALGVEAWWFLGDLCAIGPEPSAVLERVNALDDACFVRGNTDRYVVTGEVPPPSVSEAQADPGLVPLFANIAASFAWTKGYLSARGWLEWLDGLPLERRWTARSGHCVLGVHASPGRDDGEGVHPGRSDDDLRGLVASSEADVVLVGHTHEPMARTVEGVLVANVGSVGNPVTADTRASYALMECTDSTLEITHRRVGYDLAAFEDTVRRSRHPAAGYILAHARGEVAGRPPHPHHRPAAVGTRVRLETTRGPR